MNDIVHSLLRLSLLMLLVLTPGVVPMANAQVPQQTAALACQPGSIPNPGTIAGTVRGPDGQPLPGVAVTAYATTGATTASGTTNVAGEYYITLAPGSYVLEFKPSQGAFQVVWYKSGSSPLDATAVEVKSDTIVGGIDVKLTAGAQFNVALRDPDGAPVRQSQISVFDRFGRKVAGGQTDDRGQVRTTPGLPSGSYRLQARPPYGSPLLAQYHTQKPTLDAADPLTVTQAISVEVPMTLERGASLHGTVTNAATGAPLASIAVEARTADNDVYAVTTDAQGRYSIAGIPSGTYQVAFKAAQPKPSSPAPLRRLITLSAPNAQTGFDAALTSGGAITGRVTTADGTPIPDVYVKARDIDGAVESSGSTAADGTYTIHGLGSGRYTLTYAHFNYPVLAPVEQVTVAVPNTTAVAATVLSTGGAISGNVTDPDGKPVEGVLVTVLDAASGKTLPTISYTNAAGSYTTTTPLASGSYIVKFQPPSADWLCPLAIEYSGNAPTAAAATRVQVSGPTTVRGIDAKLETGSHISGQITEAGSGLPLTSAVEVYDATGALVTNGYGSLGHYRTSAALPVGTYRVRFVADDYVAMFYGGSTVLEAAAKVPSGATNINMALPRGGTLTGRISASDSGAPLEHAAVTLYGAGNRVVVTQLTSFDGSYSFRSSLPSGVYRIGVAPGKREDGTPYFTGYEAVFSGGARSLDTAEPISLAAPKTVSADLAMPSTSTLPTPPPSPAPSSPAPSPRSFRAYVPVARR